MYMIACWTFAKVSLCKGGNILIQMSVTAKIFFFFLQKPRAWPSSKH